VPTEGFTVSLTIQTEPVPLYPDERGGFRVGNSRVTLDVVIRAHKGGASPEEIVRAYDALQLADVYAIIGFYLRHEKEVNDYLGEREAVAEALEKEIGAAQPAEENLRAKLLARRITVRPENASSRS
jgi:uncharacterized protein (DUF433 family)